MAYATYVAALADASLQDNQQDAPFVCFSKTLELMEAGLDYQVLTNILKFKSWLDLGSASILMSVSLSSGWSRLLTFLSNMAPASVQSIIMRMRDVAISIPISLSCSISFKPLIFETLETISLKSEIKQELRQFMDQLYEEYVGIHLKSKKFIDSLADWGQLLKEEKKWKIAVDAMGEITHLRPSLRVSIKP